MPQMKLIGFTIVVLCSTLSACAFQDDSSECLYDCTLCSTASGCPSDRCGILVVMSASCVGVSSPAEVAVGGCVEDQELEPGSSIVLCATVMENKAGKVTVRSEEWIWQKTVNCEGNKAGGLIPLTLECDTDE